MSHDAFIGEKQSLSAAQRKLVPNDIIPNLSMKQRKRCNGQPQSGGNASKIDDNQQFLKHEFQK